MNMGPIEVNPSHIFGSARNAKGQGVCSGYVVEKQEKSNVDVRLSIRDVSAFPLACRSATT